MTDTLTEPLPPLRPTEKSAYIETDTFCVECGYNLHTQPVTRDERLGIFVCRCPECGRFHPAGTGMTAQKVWLSRFATALLVFWVLVVLTVIVLIGFGFGGLQVGHLETFTYRKLVTADGRDAQWKQITAKGGGTSYQVVAKGTTKPIQQWRMVYTLHPPADIEDDSPFGYRNLNQ
jgi:hypothetical protein